MIPTSVVVIPEGATVSTLGALLGPLAASALIAGLVTLGVLVVRLVSAHRFVPDQHQNTTVRAIPLHGRESIFRKRPPGGWPTVVAGLALTITAAQPAEGGRRIFEPVRREATIEVGVRNNLNSLSPEVQRTLMSALGTNDPHDFDYFAADFTLPAATTTELATYARQAGKAEAIRWFCESYADPAPASLRALLVTAAVTGGSSGARAGDALVCPAPEGRRRSSAPNGDESLGDAVLRFFVGFVSAFFHALAPTIGIEGRALAGAECAASDEMRAAFDATVCKDLLLPRRRARAFARIVRVAARAGACLRLRGGEHRIPPGGTPFSVLSVSVAPCF